MSLSDLASIGSFISGLAVLLSLIFLYFQLRQVNAQVLQTEKNQRALMNQGVATRVTDMMMFFAQPENRSLLARMGAGESDFSADEIAFFSYSLRISMIAAQDTYVQHRQGLADQIIYENTLAAMRVVMSQPVNRAIWRAQRSSYAPEWASYSDNLIANISLAKSHDAVAEFKDDLAEVMR